MPRPKTVLQNEFPYHLSARCINREWFQIPIDRVWEIMCSHLFFAHRCFQLQIHQFVLMNNHFHLLATTPNSNIDKVMAFFMKKTSDDLSRDSGRINQTYGGRYHRGVITSHHYYLNAYKYLYRNPVEANLVDKAEKYRYSTLRGLLGFEHLLIPIAEDTTLFSDTEGVLSWINRQPSKDGLNSVAEALRKRKFVLPRDRGSRRPNVLENDLL